MAASSRLPRSERPTPHCAGTRSGLPFSTTYVASSAALPFPNVLDRVDGAGRDEQDLSGLQRYRRLARRAGTPVRPRWSRRFLRPDGCAGGARAGGKIDAHLTTSRPGMLRSCRWRSVRVSPGAWARATSSTRALPIVSAANRRDSHGLHEDPPLDPGSPRDHRSDLNAARSSVTKKLRLLPRREVPALGELVVVDQLGIRLLRPAPRGLIELVREGAHGDRDGDVLRRRRSASLLSQ